MGRWPTKGELLEYYACDDVVAAIYYQARRWQLRLQFGKTCMLEPASEKDVRNTVLRQLEDFTCGLKETEKPGKYPTMHLLRERGEGAEVRYDYMAETDPPSWRRAFDDIIPALDALDAHGAYYRIKFSGHRSLHLLIPAEAFPRTFRGRPMNEQFELVQKKINAYLPFPRRVDLPVGLRVAYSTHPKGSLVSIPLRRRELPGFQPWMASIHTVAVDFDWFEVPEDAVERTEQFLHAAFESDEPCKVDPPAFEPLPIAVYTGDPPLGEAEVLAGLDSEHPQERVAAARAALTQNIRLPQEKQSRLLQDPEPDVIWFGTEIFLRHDGAPAIDDIVHLLGQKDDYLIGLGDDLLVRSNLRTDALCEYLTQQERISSRTVVVARKIAELDFSALEHLPENIQATSLQEWFAKAWVVCGSALCIGWRPDAAAVFENACRQPERYPAGEKERADAIRQLELLLQMRNNRGGRQIQDEPLFAAADALVRYGHDLRDVVLAMLYSDRTPTSNGAMRHLTRLWWDDAIDLLIQFLDASSSRRKSAFKALVDIDEPAVPSLIHAARTLQSPRVVIRCMDALGQIGDPRAVPVLREIAHRPGDRIPHCARVALQRDFGIQVQVRES